MNGDHVPFDAIKETPDKPTYHEKFRDGLNNFYLHFPYVYEKDGTMLTSPGFYRSMIKENEWDKTMLELYPDSGNPYNESNKYLNQTYRQFNQEIDDTAQELGVSTSDISQFITTLQSHKVDEQLWKRGWELFFPIYAALREKGYNWQDLCG